MAPTLTITPAGLIEYQRELVRTGKTIPLGRMQKIAIGPSRDYTPPPDDPYIQRYGRMIELRDRFLPIAQSPDRSLVLVTAPLLDRQGQVRLPDLPDPDWKPPAPTLEEIEGREERDPKTGKMRRVLVERAAAAQPMLAQRLTDRCEIAGGQPAVLEGTNFLVFQPVLRVAFQPEIENRLLGTAWTMEFFPDAEGKHCAFLVDAKNGECHFLFGRYDIFTPAGE